MIIGIAVALWSASGYVAAFMRAANIMYEMPEGRPIWKTLPLRLAITTVLIILTAAGAVAVTFTGGLAEQAGKMLGLGDTAVTVWNIVKWPVLVLAVMLVLALLYWAAPNVAHPGFRWVTPAACSPSSCGSSPPRRSGSTWPTSAPTPRRTPPSPASSSS
nr:hypothetical protein GCM10020093_064740 [Planobispora longispora]